MDLVASGELTLFEFQTMGERRAGQSPMSNINGDHVDEAVGFRIMVMNVYHGKCGVGKIRVADDDDFDDGVPRAAV